MTSFHVHPTIERDPRDRAIAPVLAAPLVTPALTIQHRLRRNEASRIERLAFAGAGTIGREGKAAPVLEDHPLAELRLVSALAS